MISILINAYAVSPNHGSEPGVGWNWVIEIAKYCNVHVITEAEFKNEIEVALQNLPQKDNINFYFNDIGEKARKMCWNQGDYRFYYYYNKWQKKTYEIALEVIKNNKIDIIHQLNMIGYREPGYLWKIKEIPLVWGPVGGFGGIPIEYLLDFGSKGAFKQILKNIINKIQVFQPNVYKAIKHSNLILAANSESRVALQKLRKDEVLLLNETGTTNVIKPNRDFQSNVFKILWVGKFDNRKALPLALKTIKQLDNIPVELTIIGVDKTKIDNKLFAELKNVRYYSWISHSEVQEYFKNSHVLFFTSLSEGTPHVVIEAIANGLPVICHDICGQGDVINAGCGIKIPLKNPKSSIEEFSKAILKLYKDRNLLKRLSDGAYERAQEITWENKIQVLLKQYKKVKW